VVLQPTRRHDGSAVQRGENKEAREQANNPLIEDGPKLIPSVTRVYRSRDLYVYLQAYERDAVRYPLAAVVTLLKGEEVVESPAYTVTEIMDPKSKAVPFRLSLPLGPVEPGVCVSDYRLDHGAESRVLAAPIKMFLNAHANPRRLAMKLGCLHRSWVSLRRWLALRAGPPELARHARATGPPNPCCLKITQSADGKFTGQGFPSIKAGAIPMESPSADEQ
jgi:hypothetical protein